MRLLAGAGCAVMLLVQEPGTSANPSDTHAPPEISGVCASCHSFRPGERHRAGPNLHGIASRKAGGDPTYAYSTALATQRFVWTRQRLEAFLANPQAAVPGTRMRFRVRSAKARTEIARWLLGNSRPAAPEELP